MCWAAQVGDDSEQARFELVVMSARCRLLLSAVSGVCGVVVVLVLVRPPCAW